MDSHMLEDDERKAMTREDCERLRCTLDITVKILLIVCFTFAAGMVVGCLCRSGPAKAEVRR